MTPKEYENRVWMFPCPCLRTHSTPILDMGNNNVEEVLHSGSCHCGKVRFTVRAPAVLHVVVCNCSICHFKQGRFFIVPKRKFEITEGLEHITTYRFNTGLARHTFCSVCGTQAFYYPRSNPDGVSKSLIKRSRIKIGRENVFSFSFLFRCCAVLHHQRHGEGRDDGDVRRAELGGRDGEEEGDHEGTERSDLKIHAKENNFP